MRILSAAALLICVFAATVAAQPNALVPGSCLLFPTVDSRDGLGKGTIISVTNTCASKMVGKNNWRYGDIYLHYYYVDKVSCMVSNIGNVWLTPNDTLTVIAGDHNKSLQQGFLYVVAEDPETGALVNFNYLIGSEIVVDAKQNKLWSIPAIAFRSHADNQEKVDTLGRFLADLNGNGSFDFDGSEYDFWPDELFISSFFEQGGAFESEIILVSALPGDYRVFVNFDYYNNDEDAYSYYGFQFKCWLNTTLLAISNGFGRLTGTSTEANTGWSRINGGSAIHVLTGKRWYKNELRGGPEDAPIIGAFVERVKSSPYEYGHLLHHRGSQNGNEFPHSDNS